MSIPRKHAWRFAFVAAGITMAIGGSNHPEGDAEDSLRGELATMTSDDAWVMSHTFLAAGAALLALGLWSACRNRSWPSSTHRALRVVAITMSLYFVETIAHLASAIDTDALANGDTAPIASAHVVLAILLYPISGITLAWLNTRVFRAARLEMKPIAVVGIAAGILHATSVPLTLLSPDTEFSGVFASAGILLAVWSVGLGIGGLRNDARDRIDRRSEREMAGLVQRGSYREAESQLWGSLGAQPTERWVDLERLGVRVRVQEVGAGEPVIFLHGGPSAGTTWAPLVAQLPEFRSIVVDRPGTGLSDPLEVTARNLDLFADAFVVDLLDALELSRVHVVASSFGGFLALRAAAIAPERFVRMVQMACPAGASDMVVPPFMRAAAIGPVRRLITALPPSERAARSMLRQIGHGKTIDAGGISPEFMQWYLSLQRDTPTMRNDLHTIGSLVSSTGKMHPALMLSDGLLGRVDVPTYFYWGADDPFGGVEVATTMVDLLGDATLEMVPDAGHLPWLDDPASAARAVSTFLESQSRSNTLTADRVEIT